MRGDDRAAPISEEDGTGDQEAVGRHGEVHGRRRCDHSNQRKEKWEWAGLGRE
jgi:hypothetical protein